MANLERYLLHRHLAGEEMEILKREILLVRRLRVVAVTHVENVLLHILLDYEPRTAAEAQPLTLADGMEPQALWVPIRLPVSISITSPGFSPRYRRM